MNHWTKSKNRPRPLSGRGLRYKGLVYELLQNVWTLIKGYKCSTQSGSTLFVNNQQIHVNAGDKHFI